VEAVLRALADQSRRTMLDTLADGPATAGELAALLPIARPGVSRHLRVLREAGLVEVRQEAQRRVYSLRPEPLAEVDDWLGRYRALWHAFVTLARPRRRVPVTASMALHSHGSHAHGLPARTRYGAAAPPIHGQGSVTSAGRASTGVTPVI
jgi:DNA-binding transcriptional ArsR family regulator